MRFLRWRPYVTPVRNAFSIAFQAFFGARKMVQKFPIKIGLYRCFQSKLGADFLCIEELRSLAVQCISFRPSIRHIASQRGQSDWGLFGVKYFGQKMQKRIAKIDVLGPINVVIFFYRHNRQRLFPINPNHHKFRQKDVRKA